MNRLLAPSTWVAVVVAVCVQLSAAAQEAGEAQPALPEARSRQHIDPCGRTTTQSYLTYSMTPNWAHGTRVGKFLVAGDPQYPRIIKENGEGGEDPTKAYEQLREVFGRVAALRQAEHYVPIFINGDLTEFGHGEERRRTQGLFPLMHGSKMGPLFFPGLGNHDYENNVEDCANNGCARDSVCDLAQWIWEVSLMSHAPKFADYKFSEDKLRGSLAYSVTIGRLHFVQLNNYITYRKTFQSNIDGTSGKATYQIDSALRWLEGDLREARAAGLIIFLNMHNRAAWNTTEYDAKVRSLVQDYGVSAVFAGHYHDQQGSYPTERFGSVPVFQTGALLNGAFMRVDYNVDNRTADVHSHTRDGTKFVQTIPLVVGHALPPMTKDFSDAEITFYEGGSASQKAVCDVMTGSRPRFNMNGAYGCSNDEARSMVIHKAKKGTIIYLYGAYNQHGNEGFARIRVTDDILLPIMIGSFDRDYVGQKWDIDHYGEEGLDGKISSVMVRESGDYSGGFVALFEASHREQSVVCTESVASNRSYDMGGQCANDEAKSAEFHWVRAGTEVCYYGNWGQSTSQGHTCIYFRSNLSWAGVSSFDSNYDGAGMRISHYGSSIGGKISSTRVRVDVRESSLPAFEGPVERGDGHPHFKEVREGDVPVYQRNGEVL